MKEIIDKLWTWLLQNSLFQRPICLWGKGNYLFRAKMEGNLGEKILISKGKI